MEKIPNFKREDGSDLNRFEDEKRGEILKYVKEKRRERDLILKESSSWKTKLKYMLGGADSQTLKTNASEIQERLYKEVDSKKRHLFTELKGEARETFESTISRPLRSVEDLYFKKGQIDIESPEYLDLLKQERDMTLNFNHQNLLEAISSDGFQEGTLRQVSQFLQSGATAYSYTSRDSYLGNKNIFDKDFKGLPVDISRSLFEGVNLTLEKDGVFYPKNDNSLFECISNALYFCDGDIDKKTIENIHILIKEKFSGLSIYDISHLGHLVNFADKNFPEVAEIIKQKIELLFKNKSWQEIDSACHSGSKTLSSIALDQLRTNLEQYGLDLDRFIQAWGLHPSATYFDLEANMLMIENLEAQRPGISERLHAIFGVKEFNRYPEEVLIAQFDEIDTTVPYGVVLYTNEDHNRAFDTDREKIKKIFEKTRDNGLHMRVAEFESKYELIKRLIVLNDRYGKYNKISYVLLGAHGSEESFQVTWVDTVQKGDFDGKGVQRIKDFFIEKPEIVLASCSTGVENGIGQKISEVYQANVHAPSTPTNVKSIDVSFDENNKPLFSVEYREDVLRNYSNGAKV